MKEQSFTWNWEEPEARRAFAEWVGFPDDAQTASEVDRIEALLGLKPPMRVLDVGCGTGRHCLEMARRKYVVTGIDIAEDWLGEAAADAKKPGPRDSASAPERLRAER
jgi:2-polyprenyl-3-methyl-5-hydroxy-6-metoxy-1,4-benzoquinol methylase